MSPKQVARLVWVVVAILSVDTATDLPIAIGGSRSPGGLALQVALAMFPAGLSVFLLQLHRWAWRTAVAYGGVMAFSAVSLVLGRGRYFHAFTGNYLLQALLDFRLVAIPIAGAVLLGILTRPPVKAAYGPLEPPPTTP